MMARTVQLNYPIKAEIRFDNFVIVMVIIRNILIITGIIIGCHFSII